MVVRGQRDKIQIEPTGDKKFGNEGMGGVQY